MSVARRFSLLSAAFALAIGAAVTLPASRGHAADYAAPIFSYAVDRDQAVPAVADSAPEAAVAEPVAAELECMAKVVLHEAGNQPRDGKVAVAQTLLNRLATGRFGGSICEVVNAPGQFFKTAAYNPSRDSDGWADAVAVAHDVLTGDAAAVAPGAMFFRAASSSMPAFFRSRQRIASIGAHVFYR